MTSHFLDPESYLLSGYALPVLAVGGAIAALGVFVLVRERCSRIGKLFLLLCLSVGLYLGATGMNYASRDDALSLLWIRISQLGAVFIPMTVLALAADCFGLLHRYRFIVAGSALLSVSSALAVFLTDLHVAGGTRFFWGNYARYGPLGFAFLAYFFGIMVFVLRLFWREHRHSTTARERERTRSLLVAFSGGYIGAVDFLPTLGIDCYPFGYAPIFFFVVMSAYTVVRYRLVEITPELAAGRILETMKGAVIVSDLDGKIRLVNRSALEMLGYQKSEVLGQELASILPAVAESVDGGPTDERSFDREAVWLARDGKPHDVLVASAPLTEHGNYQVGTVHVAYDVSERKRAERTLRESEEKQRTLITALPDVIMRFNAECRHLFASENVVGVTGIPAAAFIGKTHHELGFPEKMCEFWEHAIRRPFVTGLPYETEFAIDGPAGRIIFNWRLTPDKDESGGVRTVLAVARDITERRRNEEEQQKLVSIVEASSDLIGIADLEGKLLYQNTAGLRLVGLETSEEARGKSIRDFHFEADYRKFEQEIIPAIMQNGNWTGETAFRHFKTGAPVPVEMNGFLVRDAVTGRPIALANISRDIRERRLLEAERLKSQKLESIGTLAGGIAHDFNNLLQGVFGYISLAKMRSEGQEKTLEALQEAEKALQMSVHLTNQLLTFAKGGKPIKRTIDLVPLIENAARFSLSGSRSSFRMTAAEGLWRADADEGQISQVIQNIVLNADQAMPDPGTVEITAKNVQMPGPGVPQELLPGRYVEVAIADSGAGIQERNLRRIFDPYFTTKERGSGLGLATSYSIIKSHGGEIAVTSEVGKGTTFRIYLPAQEAAAPEERPAPTAAASAAGRTGKILVMDDEDFILNVAGELLRTLGHEVETALNGEEAVWKYAEAMHQGKPFDIAILDLTIRGGMGGTETVRRLLEMDQKARAVVSSGYSEDSALAEYEHQGFVAVLKKPYKVDELKSVIERLLI